MIDTSKRFTRKDRDAVTGKELDILIRKGSIPVIKNGEPITLAKSASDMMTVNVMDEKALEIPGKNIPRKLRYPFSQLDWGLVENVPLLSTFKSVNPPALLINDSVPNRLLEQTYFLFRKGEETRALLFNIAKKAKKDYLGQLIIADAWLDEELDEKLLEKTNTIPLEPNLRAIILGFEQINPRFIERYLKNPPDRGKKLNKLVARAAINQLLLSERSDFEEDRATADRVEKWIFKDKRDLFPGKTLEFFATSTNENTRKNVVCLPNLSENVGLFIGLQDPSNENLKALARCTTSCNALDAIEVNENASHSTMATVSARKRELGCD